MALKEIKASDLQANMFDMFSKNWALLSAGTEQTCNTMTVSWGGVGVLWGKNVATIYVRPGRFTYEFCEKEQFFSLSFTGEETREDLKILGKLSGRDGDKLARTKLSMDFADGVPYIKQANLVMVCKKLYHTDIDPALFYEPVETEKHYPLKDYHRMYIGEIVKVMQTD